MSSVHRLLWRTVAGWRAVVGVLERRLRGIWSHWNLLRWLRGVLGVPTLRWCNWSGLLASTAAVVRVHVLLELGALLLWCNRSD